MSMRCASLAAACFLAARGLGCTSSNLVRVEPTTAPASHAWHLGRDEAFAFAAQGYGDHGETRAGILVQDLRDDRWFFLTQVSTEGATFGRSPPFNEVKLSVSWDFTRFATQPSVELPLKTSGSVVLPYTVIFNRDGYRIDLNDRHLPEYSKSELIVRKSDLIDAVDRSSTR